MVICKTLNTNTRPPNKACLGRHVQAKQQLVQGNSLNNNQDKIYLHSMWGRREELRNF